MPGPEPEPLIAESSERDEHREGVVLHIKGAVPPELWNRLRTKVLPKLRAGSELRGGIDFSVTFPAELAGNVRAEIQQALDDVDLADEVKLD